MLKRTLFSVVAASFIWMLALVPARAQMHYTTDELTKSVVTTEYVEESKSLSIKIEERVELAAFNNVVKLAGLKRKLSKGSYTVFAPTNIAFANFLQSKQQIFNETSAQLTEIVKYHIVKGVVKVEELEDGQYLRTLQGQYLRVSKKGNTILINGAPLVKTNQVATNGIMHTMNNIAVIPNP